MRDLTFAVRSLRRSPVLLGVALLSIMLGITAATSVFTVVDAALLRLPPFPNADRLVVVYEHRTDPGAASRPERWSWPRARLLCERTTSFESIATYSPAVLTITDGDPEPVNVELVSSRYLATLHMLPVIGRSFTTDVDETSAGADVVIIGNALWHRRFAADSGLVGRRIRVNDIALTVIGIAPPDFAGITGRAQLWIPATMAPRLSFTDYLVTNQNFISVIARLRNDRTVQQARAELSELGAVITRAFPVAGAPDGATYVGTALALNEARVDPSTRRPLYILLAGVACLLLLSCANVAGLLLGRGVSRRRELAIRISTGATRWRIVSQLLTESSLIAAAGGVLGALLAALAAPHLVLPFAPPRGYNSYGAISEFSVPRVNARAVLFCIAVSALTAIAFGLLPAWRATRVDLTRDLKDGAGTGGAYGGVALRQLVVGIETGLAVVLLFLGGLLLASWRRMQNTDVGFDRSHLITFQLRPSEVEYPPAKAPALIDRVLSEVKRLRDVESATVDGCAPLGTGCASSTLFIIGRPLARPEDAPLVLRHYVAPDHFKTLEIPLIRGRAFDARDRAGARRVAIISQSAAARFWPHDDPIGKQVWFGGGSSFDRPDSSAEIIGIVGDVAYQPLDEHPFQADFYTPYAQFTYATRTVLVRTRGNPASAVPALRRAVRDADPALALFDVETMEQRMSQSWSRLTYQSQLLTAFAAVALALAATGIFAMIVQIVADRRRELGIRLALGATAAHILGSVAREGAAPAMVGLAAGLLVSLPAARLLRSTVYGIQTRDPTIVVAVVATTMIAVLSASYLAARRVLVIRTAEALRQL